MNTRNILASSSATPWMVLCVGSILTASALAQTQRYYPQNSAGYPQQPQYSQPPAGYQQPATGYGAPGYANPQQPQKRFENPLEFLPKFGKRLSEMTRRLFYGRNPTGWDQPPQGQGYSLEGNPRYPTQPGYAQPPAGYYPQQPAYQQPQAPFPTQPGYSYPPGQTPPSSSSGKTTAQTPAPAPLPQKSSTSRTYTPPKVSSSTPKTTTPKISAPEPVAPKPPVPAPTPPPTVASRRSETTPPPEPPRTASSSSSFPRGGKTSKPGRVTSPYPPYKELDVTGLDSGSLALDPTTQKVFEVP